MEKLPGTELEDEALITHYQASGDTAWLAPLVQRHTAPLRALLLPVVGNPADVDDLV